MILVSACLLGRRVKYDGGENGNAILIAAEARGRFLPICPEGAGALSIPRPPAEICGGIGADVWQGTARVVDATGVDVTAAFCRGATSVCKLCSEHRVTAAILKANSPSCGARFVYDGTFSRTKRKGQGVAAARLAKLGIPLYEEQDITELLITRLIEADMAGG